MKITVVGAGNVGATTVKCLADKDFANEIVMVDIVPGVPQGKALDISQGLALKGIDTCVVGTNNYEDTRDSDIVVVTAGLPRKPDMTREDLLNANAKILNDIAKQIAATSPEAILIVVTNPLDVMTNLAYQVTGFPKNRVIGMAGVLDCSRFKYFIAKELGVSMDDVYTSMLGNHGDTMVPLLSCTTVHGVPIRHLLAKEELDKLVTRARNGGGEIVNLLRTGSAYYAPAESITRMVEAIIKDKGEVLPCAAYCEGEFGISGTCCGVPVRLGRKGVLGIVEMPLSEDELAQLHNAAKVVKENTALMKL